MTILAPSEARYALAVPVVVIGAGGCGLTAALAARDANVEVIVLERDATPNGSTGMSTGLIPAAGTRFQLERGIDDSPELFANDILRKAEAQTDTAIVSKLARESARTIEFLVDRHNVKLSLVDSFQYPGHSVKRMHGTANRTGEELMAGLSAACARAGVDILNQALVTALFATPQGDVHGVRIARPDGSAEDIQCGALILASSGFAGNQAMVAQYIPEICGATFFGHSGNKGDAVRWGLELGAAVRDMGAYQGHGGLAAGRGIPILWPLIMEGGYQVNALGLRFSNETLGYSEQAVKVVAQPGGIAWDIYDARLHTLMLEFQDYRDAVSARAILSAADSAGLALATGLPQAALEQTIAAVAGMTRGELPCPFGRDFTRKPALQLPYYAVRVTGALFHTQGGLVVNERAQVLREDGTAFPNLFAGGGAARGVSGPGASGYLAGNGLLTATTLGRLAGETAAALMQGPLND
jgi:fumarate reductase flavoprotein subunit